VAGYPTALGSTVDLVQGKARASAYYSLDPDSRFVLAGLIGLGAMGGAELADIPANWRFYAGGGGSVRGYPWNSLGPTGLFGLAVIGGRSLFQASAELRVRVTDTIGIVPFFDAGNAFATSFPNFSTPLATAVGVGLRYYTAIGPIRADLAFPLERAPAVGRWRSTSASGRLSNDVACWSPRLQADGADGRAYRPHRAGARDRSGQGRSRRSSFASAVLGNDECLDRRGGRRAVL
jgi:hypothetical protein